MDLIDNGFDLIVLLRPVASHLAHPCLVPGRFWRRSCSARGWSRFGQRVVSFKARPPARNLHPPRCSHQRSGGLGPPRHQTLGVQTQPPVDAPQGVELLSCLARWPHNGTHDAESSKGQSRGHVCRGQWKRLICRSRKTLRTRQSSSLSFYFYLSIDLAIYWPTNPSINRPIHICIYLTN